MKKMLCEISHSLTDLVHSELENLDNVNTNEMGCVIYMIKNLQEAIYYHAMAEKMEDKKE